MYRYSALNILDQAKYEKAADIVFNKFTDLPRGPQVKISRKFKNFFIL